jgi:hypothetical protein
MIRQTVLVDHAADHSLPSGRLRETGGFYIYSKGVKGFKKEEDEEKS